MSQVKAREDFEYWLADMDDALDRFLHALPDEVSKRLDFTPASLDVLEQWILERYQSPEQMLPPSEALIVDGVARYIGETFRKTIGGHWDIRLDDPKYVFYGRPQLTGFSDKPTPMCPLLLATASANRRTSKYLSGVLQSYVKDRDRQRQKV